MNISWLVDQIAQDAANDAPLPAIVIDVNPTEGIVNIPSLSSIFNLWMWFTVSGAPPLR